MTAALSIDRYKTLLAAYGARLELWPETEREAARALLERSEEARALARAEAGLDSLFSRVESPELSAGLLQKLAELPIRHPQAQKLWPFRRVWVPALAWAAAAVLGIALGSVAPDADGGGADAGAAVEASESSATNAASDDEANDDDEERELLEMALGPAFELEETP